jgi:hypothetical protein
MSAMPERIQRKRTKGWKIPPDTVSVTRPGIFGNPFPADIYGQEIAVDLFRRWLSGNMSMRELSECSTCHSFGDISMVTLRSILREQLPKLRGKNLACWCSKDVPCHADELLTLANK